MSFCLLDNAKNHFKICKGKIVPTSKEVLTSRLGGTKLSHPIGKFILPDWVGQNCPRLGGSLDFLTGWEKIVPDWSEVKTFRLGGGFLDCIQGRS